MSDDTFINGYCERECENYKQLNQTIAQLREENEKLNIILFHHENGLSHPDFKPELEIARLQSELTALRAKLDRSRLIKIILNHLLPEVIRQENGDKILKQGISVEQLADAILANTHTKEGGMG